MKNLIMTALLVLSTNALAAAPSPTLLCTLTKVEGDQRTPLDGINFGLAELKRENVTGVGEVARFESKVELLQLGRTKIYVEASVDYVVRANRFTPFNVILIIKTKDDSKFGMYHMKTSEGTKVTDAFGFNQNDDDYLAVCNLAPYKILPPNQ